MKKKANLNVAAFFLAALMLIAEIAYCPQQVMAKEGLWNTSQEGELIPMTIEGVGTIYYSLDEKNNASIDKFVIVEGVSGKINFTVPSKVETVTEETQVSYPVKKIGVCAFMNCNIFKSVTIPTSVTTLSNGAFYNCKNLKSLIFKSKSTKVGKYAVGYVAASSAENVNVGTEENEIMSDPKRIDSLVITGTSKKAEASKYCAKNGFTFKYKSGSKTKYIYGYPTIKVSNSSSGITVRWAKVGLVNNYYVYKTTDGVRWRKVKTTKSGSYTDKKVANGKRAYYIVYANKGRVQTVSERLVGYRVKKTTLSSVTSDGSTLTVKFAKNSAASGYQIQYSLSENFENAITETVKKSSKSKITKKIEELADGTYYVRVRAYKSAEKKKFYGVFSSVKSVVITTQTPDVPDSSTN